MVKAADDGSQRIELLKQIATAVNAFKTDELYGLLIDTDGKVLNASRALNEMRLDFANYMQSIKDEVGPEADELVDAISKDVKKIPAELITDNTIIKLVILSDALLWVPDGNANALMHFAVASASATTLNFDKVTDEERALKEAYERKQQAVIERLQQQCQRYFIHLITAIHKEAGRPDPNFSEINLDSFSEEDWVKAAANKNASLQSAIEKFNVVYGMYSKLDNADDSPVRRIYRFKIDFEDKNNRKILEKRRDSAGIIFLKVVASILTLGVALPFLFSVKGVDFADKVARNLPKNKP